MFPWDIDAASLSDFPVMMVTLVCEEGCSRDG